MLKLSDLAARPDFDLGPISVSPARRTVSGPAGEAHLEPLVMQVFLLLLDLRGTVVSRTDLFDQGGKIRKTFRPDNGIARWRGRRSDVRRLRFRRFRVTTRNEHRDCRGRYPGAGCFRRLHAFLLRRQNGFCLKTE